MDSTPPRVHPQQALAVYVEPLTAGRRVAIFGDASVGLGARVAELGARSVHVWDPDPERARREAERTPPGVSVRALLGDELEAHEGAYDLAIVSDLGAFADPEELLALVRRVVGEEGAALVAGPGAAAGEADDEERPPLDYYELYDLVAHEFRDVTMIAEVPFRGVALAELGDADGDSPAVSVDTQLADADRTPSAFLALASETGVRLDPYAIIELPGGPAAREVPAAADEAVVAAGFRAIGLAAQVDELAARLAEAERELQTLPRLQSALVDRAARIAELEGALGERVRELEELSAEYLRARTAIEVAQEAAVRLDALAARAERAETALAVAEPELQRVVEAQAREHARFEEALQERARVIGGLENELARRERMIRELVDALQEAAHTARGVPTSSAAGGGWASSPPEGSVSRPRAAAQTDPAAGPRDPFEADALAAQNARLRQQLDALALDLARREGEAQASAWAIAELERRLEDRSERPRAPAAAPERPPQPTAAARERPPQPTAAAPGPVPELASVLDELDVLRRALAQEHAARLQAESGEELARAREEIARQAELLAELRGRPHEDPPRGAPQA